MEAAKGSQNTTMIEARNISHLVSACAGAWPEDDLLVFGEQRLTYHEAEVCSAQLAQKLLAADIGKGTRVGVLFPNSPEYVVALLAIMRIGAAAVPVSTFSTAGELRQLICHADLSGLIMTDAFLNHDYVEKITQALPGIVDGPPYAMPEAPFFRHLWVWSEAPPAWSESVSGGSEVSREMLESAERQVGPADVGAIIYTSGSTGEPKGVVHSQGALLRQSIKQAADNDYRHGDRIFTSMPFFWVGGLTYKLLPAMQAGAAILGCPSGAAGDMLDFIERERVTLFLGWPHSARALQSDPAFSQRDLSSLRGGNLYAALPPDQRPADPGLVISGLGMTETAGPHTAGQRRHVESHLRDSVGWAAPGMEHRVVDPETGEDVADGGMGELWVRGDTLMIGLYKRERDEVFTVDGWYRTRDLVTRRDGHFFFEGRLDDMVKIKGASVSPREVELALMELDGVVHVAVTGVGEPNRRQLGAAVVTLPNSELEVDTVRRFLRERLSAYKVPTVYSLLPADKLPMSSSGKVDRRGLLATLTDASSG